jgi:hypothetical protein
MEFNSSPDLATLRDEAVAMAKQAVADRLVHEDSWVVGILKVVQQAARRAWLARYDMAYRGGRPRSLTYRAVRRYRSVDLARSASRCLLDWRSPSRSGPARVRYIPGLFPSAVRGAGALICSATRFCGTSESLGRQSHQPLHHGPLRRLIDTGTLGR